MSPLKRLRPQACTRRQGKPGFTLLELILVLLVLAVLSAIAVPVYNTVKENSVERVVQTTLESIERNGEAIAVSDPNLTDDQIATAALAEVDPKDGMTITRNGSEITVEHTSGTITASGSVAFSDGVGEISGPGDGGNPPAPASYVLGDVGPGGGIVFYVADSPFACGATLAASCTYLEVSPLDLMNGAFGSGPNAGFQDRWCDPSAELIGVSATAIGTGMANTTTADATCTGGAIQQAADYSNNGYSDWYLPSKAELAALYAQRATVGNLRTDANFTSVYWSSSETGASTTWYQRFSDGSVYSDIKWDNVHVRAIRAF